MDVLGKTPIIAGVCLAAAKSRYSLDIPTMQSYLYHVGLCHSEINNIHKITLNMNTGGNVLKALKISHRCVCATVNKSHSINL